MTFFHDLKKKHSELEAKLQEMADNVLWYNDPKVRVYVIASIVALESANKSLTKDIELLKATANGVDARLESIFESILTKTIEKLHNGNTEIT